MIINPADVEWSADGENTDYSTTSSSPTNSRRIQQTFDGDSPSDEDDLSDDFSLLDSDEEKRSGEVKFSQPLIQVRTRNIQENYLDKENRSFLRHLWMWLLEES